MPYLAIRCMIVSIFFLTDVSDGRQTAELQGRIDFPTVRKFVRHEAVVADDLTDTPVNQHVAYGHHTAGPANVFTDQIITRTMHVVGQQQSAASAGRVTDTFARSAFLSPCTLDYQLADGSRGEKLSEILLSAFGTVGHVKFPECIEPAGQGSLPLHDADPLPDHFQECHILLPRVFPVLQRCRTR